ncbi:MAG: hypothetical protein JXA35_09605 [Deltaproteobacteria bacterium]|nr:hypothetical protein [Deltaproteobacteria bacterium]
MERLNKITIDRLIRKGVETNSIQGFIRDLINTCTSYANLTIQELNVRMNLLGWKDIELDDHTLQLIIATSENNKRVLNYGWGDENTQNYLKFRNNDYPYLKTNKDNEPTASPVLKNLRR